MAHHIGQPQAQRVFNALQEISRYLVPPIAPNAHQEHFKELTPKVLVLSAQQELIPTRLAPSPAHSAP